jgi:putative transposase
VRAGMVDDPKDYRWCGYGEAVAGGRAARRGIGKVLESNEGVMGQNAKSQTQQERLEQYRVILFEDGGVIEPEAQLAKATASKAKRLHKGMTEQQVQRVIDKGGKLSRPQMLRCKIRYFTDGVVIGSKSFVDGYFNEKRTQFSHKRKSGARKMRHLADDKLYALRDLQKKPVG